MTVQFAHTKTDQVAKLAKFKRHIFANPAMPETCAVLAFGRLRLAFPGKTERYLFEGAAQYDRFRKLLQRVVQEHSIEILAMGVDPKNLGVHSIRKRAATYCCNGTTAGVSFSLSILCSCWMEHGWDCRLVHPSCECRRPSVWTHSGGSGCCLVSLCCFSTPLSDSGRKRGRI